MTSWWGETLEGRVETYRKWLSELPKECIQCDAEPNDLHDVGCDVACCALCGQQAISCDCNYEDGDSDWDDDENHVPKYLEIDWTGTTLPWDGYWPHMKQCVEYGVDLNMVHMLRWDQTQRKFVQD